MKSVEYGNKDGRLVVYFHGVPGAIAECALFESYAKQHNLNIICFDRFNIGPTVSREDYYQKIVTAIKSKASDGKVDVIGFSIGAYVALEVCARLNEQLGLLHLVSAAAPIDSEGLLDAMAGGAVFKLAKHRPFLFYCLSYFQKALALLAPALLFKILFSSAAGEDKALSEQGEFKRFMIPLLKHSFREGIKGYCCDIRLYSSWEGELGELNAKVSIWHGSQDNWSPFAMATTLNAMLAGAEGVKVMEGLSHYSCLFEAAPKICAQLGPP